MSNMPVLMSDVNSNLRYYKEERNKEIKKLVERITSEDHLSFSKIKNINAIMDMSDEEFNTRLYNLELRGTRGAMLWDPDERWCIRHKLNLLRRMIKHVHIR